MKRDIKPVSFSLIGPYHVADPVKEINKHVSDSKFKYLLAHADDGVIWGMIKNKELVFSGDMGAFPEISPPLRTLTLWEARLFGKQAELFIWRTESGWSLRIIADMEPMKDDIIQGESFDESYILWGTDPDGDPRGPFTPVREADLGIRHTPPIKWSGRHKIRLVYRHYINYDDQGAAFIQYSRLVDLLNGGEK